MMVDPNKLYEACVQHGIDFFTGVPDSLMKDFCNVLVQQSDRHIISANEGTSIGLAAGYHLATGKVPLVYLQNSGIGNTINPLLSLADSEVYGIPMIILVGWRGQPGTKDEPQHMKQGKVLVPLLDALGIYSEIIPDEDREAAAMMGKLVARARETSAPHAILVPANRFSKFDKPNINKSNLSLTRESAIHYVADSLSESDIVVATTGKASRELYEYRILKNGQCNDFLTVGSMGHASQIALGIAMATPDRRVICLDGDGSMIMHMGSLPIIGQAKVKNYRHILLNNCVHESVGGQPTAATNIDFPTVATSCGYRRSDTVDDASKLKASLIGFLESCGPSLLEIRIATGSRSDLGRPVSTPAQNKQIFMEHVSNVSL